MSSDWVLYENDAYIYRASTVGGCIRSLVAGRMGESATPPGQTIQRAMDASSVREDEAIAEYVKRTGHSVIWQQKRCVLPVLGLPEECEHPVLIRGHIDGLDQADDCIVEVKWLSGDNFDRYVNGGLDALGQLGNKYRWQGAVYGHANERKIRFVIGNKAAEKKDDETLWLDIGPRIHPDKLVPRQEIMDRIVAVEEYALSDELPECDQGCTKFDAYAHVHEFAAVAIGDDDLAAKLDEFWRIKCIIDGDPSAPEESPERDGLAAQMKKLGDEIKKEYDPNTYVVNGYMATISRVRSERADVNWIKKNYRDVYEAALKPSESVRLLVKKTGGGSSESGSIN